MHCTPNTFVGASNRLGGPASPAGPAAAIPCGAGPELWRREVVGYAGSAAHGALALLSKMCIRNQDQCRCSATAAVLPSSASMRHDSSRALSRGQGPPPEPWNGFCHPTPTVQLDNGMGWGRPTKLYSSQSSLQAIRLRFAWHWACPAPRRVPLGSGQTQVMGGILAAYPAI